MGSVVELSHSPADVRVLLPQLDELELEDLDYVPVVFRGFRHKAGVINSIIFL